MRVACQNCGKLFEARRSTARYCTSSCRGKATHKRQSGLDPAEPGDAQVVQLPTARKTTPKPASAPKAPAASTAAKPSRRTTAKSADTDDVNQLSPFEAAYDGQLRQAGKLDTYIGRQAMLLARRLELAAGGDTGASVASLSKELDRLMTAALTSAEPEQDALDQVQDQVLQFRGRRRRG